MKDYTIYTLCSKNFRDAYEYNISSWLKTRAKEIIIYTDDKDWKSSSPRIRIIPLFEEESDDWLVNVGRKAIVSWNVFDKAERLVFVDMDCYITEEIGDVFNQEFDIAVTRLDMDVEVSTGIFFFRANKRMRNFLSGWLKLQERYRKKGHGVRPKKTSYSQNAFDTLVRQGHKAWSLFVLPLDVIEYNRKIGPTQIPKMYEDLRTHSVKVLHLYNRVFKNEEIMKKVFRCLKEWR